jgi:parallel beta-helix repeat protein
MNRKMRASNRLGRPFSLGMVVHRSKGPWTNILVAFLMLFSTVFSVQSSGQGTGNYPAPGTGDWTISNNTHVWNDSIVLNGNLIVASGGNLTLENVTISFNSNSNGQYRFEVQNGGQLHIRDLNGTPSVIRSNTSYAYKFWIQNGSSADFTNSVVTNCGFNSWNQNTNNNTGLWISSPNVTILNCNISSNYIGIYLYNTSNIRISSCLISSNTYGIYVSDSSNLTILSNIIQNCDQDAIRVNSTGYNSIMQQNVIFYEDFNGGNISNWNLSTSGSGQLTTSTVKCVSQNKSMYMTAMGTSKGFATTPNLTYDSSQPYNYTTGAFPDSRYISCGTRRQ